MTDHPAAIAERERIVAWLRIRAKDLTPLGHDAWIEAEGLEEAVIAIERGDHITQSGE